VAPQTTPRAADDATLWCGNAFEAFALTVDDVVDSHDALDDVGSVAGLVGRVDRATGVFADVDPEGSNVEGTEAPAPATPSGDVTELLDDPSDVWPVTDRRKTDQTGDSAVPALSTDKRTSVKGPSDGSEETAAIDDLFRRIERDVTSQDRAGEDDAADGTHRSDVHATLHRSDVHATLHRSDVHATPADIHPDDTAHGDAGQNDDEARNDPGEADGGREDDATGQVTLGEETVFEWVDERTIGPRL
jgi:hypothetical protein